MRPIVARLAMLAALVAGLALAVPALAHDTGSIQPGDGSIAYMEGRTHSEIQICDNDNDGNRAYVRRIAGGAVVSPTVYDPDGAGGFCGQVAISTAFLESYVVCVQNEGCGNVVSRPF